MDNQNKVITKDKIKSYIAYLIDGERAEATINKYEHNLQELMRFFDGKELCKRNLILWKQQLEETYAPRSMNCILASMNGFFRFMGWHELYLKPLKIQRQVFSDEKKELSKEEYIRLVKTAQGIGKERLSLILQALCATGIRISELKFITVRAIEKGFTTIHNKGKFRKIFLPRKLCALLKKYIEKRGYESEYIFATKNGKPIDRSNIWREMKALCEKAKVNAEKVFPHNLRHLFARCYYSQERDLARLADILGHSSINTTRIYTLESGEVHSKQMEKLGLIIT